MKDIIPEGRLAALLAAGYRITYAPDTVFDGWFADLRDELGRVTESGGGCTQAEAAACLAGRVERDHGDAGATQAAAAGTGTGAGQVRQLLDAGYRVGFTREPSGYAASVSGPGGYEHDAIAATVAGAIWAASPLHAGDAPFPGSLPAPGVMERLDVLEERADASGRYDAGTVRALVRILADVFTEGHPDGLTARDGDQPKPEPATDAKD